MIIFLSFVLIFFARLFRCRENCLQLADGLAHFRLVRCVVQQCLTKLFSAVLQYTDREVAILVPAVRRPAKSRLKCETVYQTELLPHDDSRGCFSRFLHHKVARIKFKILIIFAEQQREDPFLQPVCLLVGTPVHEQILGARVPMVITVK